MRKTKKQIKQDILEAILSTDKIINKKAITKKKGVCYRTVCRYLPEIYRKIVQTLKENYE